MLKGSAFPCIPTLNKVTTGTFKNINGVRCYEDGHLDVKYKQIDKATGKVIGGPVISLEFVGGEDMDLGGNIFEASVVDGKFSLSGKTLA